MINIFSWDIFFLKNFADFFHYFPIKILYIHNKSNIYTSFWAINL